MYGKPEWYAKNSVVVNGAISNISYVPLKTIVSDIYGGSIVYNKVTKEVKGSIDGLEFTYTMNSKHGYKNGVYTVLTLPMIVENGIVYCPIKSLEDLFDMKMSYNVQNKSFLMVCLGKGCSEVRYI